jgi:hypothetical protein
MVHPLQWNVGDDTLLVSHRNANTADKIAHTFANLVEFLATTNLGARDLSSSCPLHDDQWSE